MELIVILVWIPLAFAACAYAWRLNRNGFVWGLVALVLSPLIAFIFLFALGEREDDDEEDEEDERVPCPFCAEQIRPEAVKCPFCRSEIPASPPDRP